ncbi:hypothetical protein CR513_30770, partial [Mucuna pruriens]
MQRNSKCRNHLCSVALPSTTIAMADGDCLPRIARTLRIKSAEGALVVQSVPSSNLRLSDVAAELEPRWLLSGSLTWSTAGLCSLLGRDRVSLKLHPIHVRTPDLLSLRKWGSCLKGQWRRAFEGRYGNLLNLLDPPLRCFTFRDFQLAPTLEEYERIIGIPLAKSPPYLFKGKNPSWASMAKLLRISKSEAWRERRNKNDLEGIPSASLEGRLGLLQQKDDWRAFIDVYALLIYGVILFLHIEDYVNLAIIDNFFAKRDRGESPVIAILANTYYSLNYCYERNGKGLRCCTSLLYLWLTTHLFHNKRRAACPIENHHWSWVKMMTKVEWTKHLDKAFEKSIRWYP